MVSDAFCGNPHFCDRLYVQVMCGHGLSSMQCMEQGGGSVHAADGIVEDDRFSFLVCNGNAILDMVKIAVTGKRCQPGTDMLTMWQRWHLEYNAGGMAYETEKGNCAGYGRGQSCKGFYYLGNKYQAKIERFGIKSSYESEGLLMI